MLLALVAIALAVSPADEQKARGLAHRSVIEYNVGDVEKALADATAAYQIDPRPALLFDLGQCHRALGHFSKALFLYRNYLHESPKAPNRALVLKLIAELEQRKATGAPALEGASGPAVASRHEKPAPEASSAPRPAERPPAAAAARPAAAPAATPPVRARPVLRAQASPQPSSAPAAAVTAPASHRRHATAWWLGGAGLATGAAGTILGVLASSALAADHPSPGAGGEVHHISPGQYQAGQNEGLAADVLWIAGGALVVTAAILLAK